MATQNFPTVTDRSVQHPYRVQLTLVEGETDVYDVEAVPGTVTQEGTLLNSTLFNSIRDDVVWGIENGGTGATTAAQARTNLEVTTWQDIYPVGAVYMSVVNTSPQTLFGGTWISLGTDKFVRVASPNDTLSSGGSDTVSLTPNNLPQHSHSASISSPGYGVVYRPESTAGRYEADANPNTGGFGVDTTSLSCTIGNSGSGEEFDIKPAYIEIYAWKRTA